MTVQLSTVNKYGHVLLSTDKRYYSVPFKLIGRRLKIKYTSTKIQVYDDNEVVAVHERYLGKGLKYITTQDHLATQHKYLAEWNPKKFMEEYIESILKKKSTDDNDILSKKEGKQLDKIIVRQITALKNSMDSHGLTIDDLILHLKNENE